MNISFTEPVVLNKKDTIAFKKYQNTPATKEEIEYAKYSDIYYKEVCERSAKREKEILDEKKLAKRKTKNK